MGHYSFMIPHTNTTVAIATEVIKIFLWLRLSAISSGGLFGMPYTTTLNSLLAIHIAN